MSAFACHKQTGEKRITSQRKLDWAISVVLNSLIPLRQKIYFVDKIIGNFFPAKIQI